MAGNSRPDPAETLRQQLEHLELQQEDAQDTESQRRPPIQRPSSAAWPREQGAPDSTWRASYDSRRESGRVRFSEELPRGRTENGPATRAQGARRSLHLDSQLYTIQSNVGGRGSTGPQSGQTQGGIDGIPRTEPSSSRHLAPPSPDDPRYSGSGSDNDLPISSAHPHQGGFDSNFKDAIVTAAETNVTLANYRDWVARQRQRQRRWTRVPTGRLKARFAPLYKRYIVEGLLRQKPLPPSKDGRHVPVNPALVRRKPLTDERSGKPYVSNHIRSSRYTLWDFLPKQLFFQFSKLANFYFLVIGVMQMIPGLSTTGTYTTIGPLIAFVALSIGKEGYDDYRRYKLDKVENRKDAWVLDPDGITTASPGRGGLKSAFKKKLEKPEADLGMTEMQGISAVSDDTAESWSKVKWEDVRVGDVIRLRRDEDIPADIVLLQATGPNGVAYIETMALDGETNLKSKQACPLLAEQCADPSCLNTCDATVVSEDPNLDLYNFDGRVTVNGQTMPLGMNQVVYRGSTLRNTNQAVGLVVNTGEECKIRMNSHKNAHAKAPAMQSIVNRIVILLVFFVIMLSFGCTIGNEIWKSEYKRDAWYLKDAGVPFKEIIIAFIIAFNTLIPLSLYVSLEIIKLGQFYLLHDVEMYDPVTNTPMAANTTTILENLGQVSYVFSDKTGTLTENVMRFRKMSVAGTAWLHDMDVQKEADERARKAEMFEKGKQKQVSRTSTTLGSIRANSSNGEHNLPRTSTASQWRPSTRRGYAQPPLLKTEDFLQYLRQKPHTTFSRKARHFLLCIALCHTCLPETNGKGEVTFQAASPDELALVEAAKDLGYLLVDRPPQSMKLEFRDFDGSDVVKSYEVLDVIEFSSKRKRMSIIIRMPDGKICMFTKGADSAILPRLKLSGLAAQKASAVENRASKRKSVEQGKALQRQSTQRNTRGSINLVRAASGLSHRRSGLRNRSVKRSTSMNRKSSLVTDEVDSWLTRLENEDMNQMVIDDDAYQSPRASMARTRSGEFTTGDDPYDGLVDERLAVNEGAVFERCFQHIDDFASEGLRTLLFAYRYLEEDDYKKWKPIYQDATTSLVNRQDRIEAAAELIEQGFDLAGVTAIEDKLQKGVPETVDKLRRADIKVWMLTGDKRETAINIAHSARICKPFSEMYILDATKGDLQERIASTLIDVGRGMIPHSVVVIDGHTLGIVEDDESLKILFFDLVARVDSVICCRASPSQKATLVKCIRRQVPSSLTLAIGDGANDIAMIQASHVGIGISGREGLQAARVSDYSIAQFRFLQRLLFVHGRWNYIRTGKYILGTFWKEIVFYLVQAQYQRYNGYTGTSLFEPASLTVFNTLFTSLPVILLGIFEQDMRAETLLAVPELYTFGQKNMAFNFKLYIWWMFMAASESVLIYHVIYGIYTCALFNADTTIFAMGTLAFTVCVVFINLKMLVLEMHNQTIISLAGLIISVGGWFMWNGALSELYPRSFGPYLVRDAFVHNFGRSAVWWLTAVVTLSAVVVLELAFGAIRRVFKPRDQDLMQELEHDEGLMDVMREHAAERGEGEVVVMQEENNNNSSKVPNKAIDATATKVSMTIATTEVASPRGVNGPISPGLPGKRLSRHMTDEYVPPAFATPTEEREDPTDPPGADASIKKEKAALTPTRRWLIDTNNRAGGEGQDYFVQSPTDIRSPPLDGLQTPGDSPRP